MKKISFTLAAIFACIFVSGQITTLPLYPTANDEITLIFDATDTPLEGLVSTGRATGNMLSGTGATTPYSRSLPALVMINGSCS